MISLQGMQTTNIGGYRVNIRPARQWEKDFVCSNRRQVSRWANMVIEDIVAPEVSIDIDDWLSRPVREFPE